MRKYTVYLIINRINGLVYVGRTCLRMCHRWQGGKGYFFNKRLYDDIVKYGPDNFLRVSVRTDLSKQEADVMEMRLIYLWRSSEPKYGYNRAIGGTASNNLGKDCYAKDYRKKLFNQNYEENKRIRNERKRKYYEEHREQRREYERNYHHKRKVLKSLRND